MRVSRPTSAVERNKGTFAEPPKPPGPVKDMRTNGNGVGKMSVPILDSSLAFRDMASKLKPERWRMGKKGGRKNRNEKPVAGALF